MQARKIDMRPIKIKSGEEYPLKDVMTTVLLFRLNGAELYKRGRLADKIEDCKEDFLYLDKKDYETLKGAFDTFSTLGKGDRKMVNKIYNAEKVEMKEKKSA